MDKRQKKTDFLKQIRPKTVISGQKCRFRDIKETKKGKESAKSLDCRPKTGDSLVIRTDAGATGGRSKKDVYPQTPIKSLCIEPPDLYTHFTNRQVNFKEKFNLKNRYDKNIISGFVCQRYFLGLRLVHTEQSGLEGQIGRNIKHGMNYRPLINLSAPFGRHLINLSDVYSKIKLLFRKAKQRVLDVNQF